MKELSLGTAQFKMYSFTSKSFKSIRNLWIDTYSIRFQIFTVLSLEPLTTSPSDVMERQRTSDSCERRTALKRKLISVIVN